MFRKPREVAAPIASDPPLRPSTGRAPTPPSYTSRQQTPTAENTTYSIATSTPLLGRSKSTSKKTPTMVAGKAKGKGNGNIMNFFKKAESSTCGSPCGNEADDQDSLFLEESPVKRQPNHTIQTPTPPREQASPKDSDIVMADSPMSRYNEDAIPNKKQRIGEVISSVAVPAEPTPQEALFRGPFVDDSDSDEMEHKLSVLGEADTKINRGVPGPAMPSRSPPSEAGIFKTEAVEPDPPPLTREPTSVGELDGFDGIEDFIDDEFPEEGEEFLERRWMEEQAELEIGLEEQDERGPDAPSNRDQECLGNKASIAPQDAGSTTCPICGGYTTGMTEEQVSTHVNDCLDGKAKPLPPHPPSMKKEISNVSSKMDSEVPGHKRFQRAAIARPGQDNPFGLSSAASTSSSAFSKLMTGHAEDVAWATAAASEQASRGKPAYQRTCPFYKIMPGFFICVDAFRYGAVAGCNAYFLSHFHSDHYIGLTSSWCHGPIYCSHVTANLVRRQLRVDPKWVVDLEFDQKVAVPGTQGVDVTMIPANHCPGSSLYLFEKVVGRGKNPKVQRVLHCGDFRACPAHVQHPQLRPDIVDTVTGRGVAQQKLDVCYLDTTYLTPKYSFPSQEDVIKACADMCVSLSKDFVDENDSWEQTKKERAGDGMVKFVRKSSIKAEAEEEDVRFKVEEQPEKDKKARGRLLVIVGTYSIGKERICLGVAKALNSKIYAPPNKQKICAALEDPELSARMTNDPLEAQVHMQMLMEIRAETLADYLTGFKPHFSRIVGFRPSGWNYRPPNSRFTESPSVQTVLHSDNWKSRYTMAELVPQRGSTREAHCFGVPYSEHSSFRELTMFCCALRIDKIIPTVNVGSAKSRERMKGWCEKWAMDKKKSGLYKVQDGQSAW